jgi:ubiquinone/menaquinone biosynthesis C-methylase UbiE
MGWSKSPTVREFRHRLKHEGTNVKLRFFGITSALVVAATLAAIAQQPSIGAPFGVHPISGRRFAQMMSAAGAAWLDRAERIEEEQPDKALDVLKIRPGAAVADVGAGSGYFTTRLSARVGPKGKVYAVEIQPEMLRLLAVRLKSDNITNVTVIQGEVDNPRLPTSAVDLEILVDVYHEFSVPQAQLWHLRDALKSDGRLVLLEYRKEDPSIPIREDHKMSVAEAKLEVEAEGFTLSQVDESLPRQHILVFTKR